MGPGPHVVKVRGTIPSKSSLRARHPEVIPSTVPNDVPRSPDRLRFQGVTGVRDRFRRVLKAFDDGRLFGTSHGSSPAAVLCLPGWARTHRDFDAALAGLDAVALDLPGFGASPPPPRPWGAAEYADAVTPVLTEMAQPSVVVGHSFGGRVAVHLAARNPGQVGALVLTGVPLLRRPGTSSPKPASVYRMARALHRRGLLGEGPMERLRQRYGSADYRHATPVMRQVLVKVLSETYEEQLATIGCPTELVWGDDDRDVPVAVAVSAHDLLATSTLTIVPGAGHLTPLSAPRELRVAVERHLRSRL